MESVRKRNHPVVENILKVMEAKGIGIDELSAKSGISRKDLERLLKNKRVIRLYEIAALSVSLDTDIDTLFGYTKED